MYEQQMRVMCPACGYTTDEVWAVGGALQDSGFFRATVACPIARKLVDAEAGQLSDFEIRNAGEEEREATAEDVDQALGPMSQWIAYTVCPECHGDHPVWDADAAVCPVCGGVGCVVESL